jgi:hypothetical protein
MLGFPHMSTSPESATFRDRALRAIAILGLIVILLLGAWGIIQIAFTLYGFLGHTGSSAGTATNKQELVTVTAPLTVTSGSPFNLSFSHTNGSGNYAYQISFSCAQGLTVQAPLPTGQLQSVPCNTPFNYTGATTNMPLTVSVSGSSPVSTTFTVAAKNLASNAVTASGTATVSVTPLAHTSNSGTTSSTSHTTSNTKTTKPKTTYVPSTRAQTLYGSPDLAVSMGTIAGANGTYSATFTIQNVGTNVTPANWTFNAWLPTSGGYTYTSAPQQSLRPGDKIIYTLSFNTGSTYTTYGSTYNNYLFGQQGWYYYQNCGYSTNYTYNGYYTYPGATYGCNGTAAQPTYYSGYPYNSSPQYNTYGSVMTVTVDPNNYVSESNESNNTVSSNIGY